MYLVKDNQESSKNYKIGSTARLEVQHCPVGIWQLYHIEKNALYFYNFELVSGFEGNLKLSLAYRDCKVSLWLAADDLYENGNRFDKQTHA